MKKIVLIILMFSFLTVETFSQEKVKEQPTAPSNAANIPAPKPPKIVPLTTEQLTPLMALIEQQRILEAKVQGMLDMLMSIMKLPSTCKPGLDKDGKPQFICPAVE